MGGRGRLLLASLWVALASVSATDCLMPSDMVLYFVQTPVILHNGVFFVYWTHRQCTAFLGPGQAVPYNEFDPTHQTVEMIRIIACPLHCLNSSSFMVPNNHLIRSLFMGGAPLGSIPPADTLSALPALQWTLWLESLGGSPPVGFYASNPGLLFTWIQHSNVPVLRNGTFPPNSALTSLVMNSNPLTMIEPGTFETMTSLTVLWLSDCHLSTLPSTVLDLVSLQSLGLSNNRITELRSGMFTGLTNMANLQVSHNPIVRIDDDFLDTVTPLAVPAVAYTPIFIATAGITTLYVPNPSAVPHGGRLLGYIPVDVGSLPRECHWVGPRLSDIDCRRCTFGYINDPTGETCIFPPFGPAASWDPSPLEDSPQMGVPDANGERTIFLRNRIELPVPQLAANPKENFVGYAEGNFIDIQYDLRFVGDIDVGCGVENMARGNTSDTPAVRLAITAWDVYRTDFEGFVDHPATLQFEVTSAGNITIDSCDSLYVTNLMLFRGWGAAAVANHSNLIDFDYLNTASAQFFQASVPHADWTPPFKVAWFDGCELSDLARREVYLTPGRYTVMVRGKGTINDPGGVYVLRMNCGPGAATRDVAEANPGGLVADRRTGRITGTPERAGEGYRMELHAIDAIGKSAEVASWVFNVRDRSFQTVLNESEVRALDPSRGIEGRYHVRQFHTIQPPTIATSNLFRFPANDDFDSLIYVLLIDPQNGTAPCLNLTVLADAVTGEGLFQIACLGNFSATLKARDDAGQEADINAWDFEVLPVDTNVPQYGPNGRGCVRGIAVDGDPMDGRFTCDCTGTGSSGDNCDIVAESSSGDSSATSRESIIAYTIVAVIVLIFALALLASQLKIYRLRYRPEDIAAMQSGLFIGMGTMHDIGPNELGFALQFEKPFPDDFGHEKAEELEGQLLGVLQALHGIPRRLASALKANDASVKVNPATDSGLLIIPQPPKLKNGEQEDFAAVLLKLAQAGDISAGCIVNDVAVAVPTRVPAEINRDRVTRLGMLGEGYYGEVVKGTLEPLHKKAGVPSLTVAVKSLKAGGDDGQRAEFLREAALMALFDHPNIVTLIGVVSVPRNIPPLLVLEYCEHGTLLSHVREADPATVDTLMLMTYCHDVASGLTFLSSRKIIHRDIAARNVLLDAANTCKVSDFGMSAALRGDNDESDYASHYVKMHGEMPVRWSSIEVLREGKFSRASDVWAYGVLVYEVMSRGQQPYNDCASLAEVAERIKAGLKLPCPEDCSEEVYTRAMLPCWATNPSDRPGFGALARTLLDFGVIRPESLDASAEETSAVDRGASESSDSEFLLRGPSIHHLSTVVWPATTKVTATIADTVDNVFNPRSADVICPRDNVKGCAYVDTLQGIEHVGRAVALLSYTWKYKLSSVINALERWANKSKRSHSSAYIWICAACLNQHRVTESKTMTPEQLASEFGPRVLAIGRILPMLEPWRNPEYLSRAWCLFELYTAIRESGQVTIDVILTKEEDTSFLKDMGTEGYTCIDSAFDNIQSENATASHPEDLKAIRQLIESKPGGFATLNRVVSNRLEQWFRQHGAVKTSGRVRRNRTQGSANNSAGSFVDHSGGSFSDDNSGSSARATTFALPSALLSDAEIANLPMSMEETDTSVVYSVVAVPSSDVNGVNGVAANPTYDYETVNTEPVRVAQAGATHGDAESNIDVSTVV
eukprot:m.194105 g.194105  ORF g.194105 m.194105 type:complete len:1680 (-) comp15199_c0_seq4:5570-10609(-)